MWIMKCLLKRDHYQSFHAGSGEDFTTGIGTRGVGCISVFAELAFYHYSCDWPFLFPYWELFVFLYRLGLRSIHLPCLVLCWPLVLWWMMLLLLWKPFSIILMNSICLPKEATYRAMKEISAPVVAIALILAAVFVPVGFIPGIVGRLYQQFAITIAISVILSAFVALSLTPALCTLLLKPSKVNKDAKGINYIFYRYNNWFERLTDKYTNGVKRSIKGARYIVLLLICICVGTWFLFKTKPSGFIPPEDGGRLFVTYQLPEASSTTQSVELMMKLMKIIGSTPGVIHYAAFSGFNILNGGANSNNGTFFVC